MTEIGEGLAIDIPAAPDKPVKKGSLRVVVKESYSSELVPEVTVKISGGPTSATGKMTDSKGTAEFSGLLPGQYRIALSDVDFELEPNEQMTTIGEGDEQVVEISVRRIATSLVIKRIHIRGLWKALRGDKGDLEYGHWWIEVNRQESYGWWPEGGVSLSGTFLGVPGRLNGGPQFGGSATRDPHHGDRAEDMFHPRVRSGATMSKIEQCITGFANGYSGKWSWPWGQNCHSFQEALMAHCKLSKSGSKKVN